MAEDVERVANALESLVLSGALSDESANALSRVNSREVARALGDHSPSRELLLVSVLVDDSTSIATDIGEIRRGYGVMLEALRKEPFSADVRVSARAMNAGLIHPYVSLAQAPGLTDANYRGSNLAPDTPLYLRSLLMFGSVVLKAQEEEDRGVNVRTFTLVITDGEDNRSGNVTAAQVRVMSTDMLEFATNHIIAGMGVGERNKVDKVDFRDIFSKMGIPRGWILTAGTSVDELLAKFRLIARVLCLAASSEAAFAQLLPGLPSD